MQPMRRSLPADRTQRRRSARRTWAAPCASKRIPSDPPRRRVAKRPARAIQTNDPGLHADLGSAAAAGENHEEAAGHYQRAVAIAPEFAQAHHWRGLALLNLGQHDAAEVCFREAAATRPRPGRVFGRAGAASGRARRPRSCVPVCARGSGSSACVAMAHWRLAITLKEELPDAEFQALQGLISRQDLSDRDRALLHFGLGAVCDVRGLYDQAAAHLETANALQLAVKTALGLRRDPEKHTRFIDRMIAAFTPDFMARTRGWGAPDPRPVFVVGLPRTGTTLVEQVLASHPRVHGAGELRDVRRIFHALPALVGQPNGDSFDALKLLTPERTRSAARPYLERMDNAAPGTALRVVDKMPDNVQLLGVIALFWPGARVIVCNRDLRDVAVSCWLTGFETHPWTNNWDLMAQWFANNQRITEHWRRTQPLELLEIRYEHLVTDLEPHARRIVQFLDLDWDRACLGFHRARRVVRTASLVQVRQPIHSRSVGRWKNYESRPRTVAPGIPAIWGQLNRVKFDVTKESDFGTPR